MSGDGLVSDGLELRAVDVDGRDRWRWLLVEEATGKPLADHPVVVDGSTEASAFTDLYRFLRWNVEPDRRVASEAAWVDRVGTWAGRELLGQCLGRLLVDRAPVTVRVVLPAGAEQLAFWPWELAHAGGVPLARQQVSLVFDVAGPSAGGPGKRPVAGALRMLAVFSLPTEQSALGLRRERYALTRLVRRLAGRRTIELEVLQYGATRARLTEIVTRRDGWDVLHLSGHGAAGQFLLECPDGSPDPIDTETLVGLLVPARHRVKLAVVSACQSAAATTAETLRLLGADISAEQLEAHVQSETETATAGVSVGLARGLAGRLGCAVLAMRYPVVDDFAIELAGRFYEGLLSRDQTVDVALRLALPAAAGATASTAAPALSIATPTLVGTVAVGLRLSPPPGRPHLDPQQTPMAGFPHEPERFVGRAGAMARASAVLAPDGRRSVVLFHGMAGAGKTTCAVELAYRHVAGFAAAVFWPAPTGDDEFASALTSLAARLEAQLADYGFTMLDKIGTAEKLARFLPRLAELCEQHRLLLVLDNLETLLTPTGTWRDPRWELLIDALAGHGGETRLVLTSRIVPAGLDASRVLTVPVHALSRDETLLLARELPYLRALLRADARPERAHLTQDAAADRARAEADRRLARRVLDVVQGHPKLLELADAAATDRDRLVAHLAAAETAAGHGGALEAFFTQGESQLDGAGFLRILTGWTASTLTILPAHSRLLMQLLCAVEDDDRRSFVLKDTWAALWRRLEQPGDPPPLADTLAPLVTAALVHSEPVGPAENPPVAYRIHPGVADAVRTRTDPAIRTAVDHELAAYWAGVSQRARDREGGEAGQVVVRAGLAAAPYLLRLQAFDPAGFLLQEGLRRDGSPATVQTTLPFLRRIADTTQMPSDLALLAHALKSVDVAEAERLLDDALTQAAAQPDHRLASAIAGHLADLLRDSGRLAEALTVTDAEAVYTRAAGLGPWTQLFGRTRRLQIVVLQGRPEQVLADLQPLLDRMAILPDRSGPDDAPETVIPWNARESTLDVGHGAAVALERWEQALTYNAAIHTSQTQRNAGPHARARTRFNDYGPLIRLGRLDEADRLLRDCQQAFTDHNDIPMLSMVFGARASLEDAQGRPSLAAELERTALRLKYLHPNPGNIAVSHNNLAGYLCSAGDNPAGCAHQLAAALLRQLTDMTHNLSVNLQTLAGHLRRLDDQTPPPTTLDELAAIVDRVDGVHLADLVARLCPDTTTADETITTLLNTAADLEAVRFQQLLEAWEPEIVLLVTAAGGDQQAAEALAQLLDQLAATDDLAALVGVWRRILAGDRDRAALTAGLDPIDSAIVTRTLDALSGPGQEPE